MSDNKVVPIMPNAMLKSLTDEELMLAYQCVQALMDARIPAAVSYADSGIIYAGDENVIGRYIAIVWLTVKGEAVITKVQTTIDSHFTLEKVQTLANGIASQFRSQIQALQNKEVAANDDSSVG